MRPIQNEIKASLTYTYYGSHNDPKYYEWANKLWDSGYTMSIKELSNKIGMSESQIRINLLKEIRHVNYSNKFIYKKTGKTECLTRVSWEEVKEYFIETSTFEVQTEIIDLYSYLCTDKKRADQILALYKKATKDGFYNKGTIPLSVLQEIDKYYITNLKLENLSPVRSLTKDVGGRVSVPWQPVKKFDFFENPNLYSIQGTKELAYREAFLRGDIKIKHSHKKVWFVKNNKDISKYKMPFLIPYDKKIVIQPIH